ncbi:MAG: EthD family reductase [Sphingobacteriaceae bacterium]|nr:MAG: EthD family reductase [Sphingobacteriaceae bacterium]
MQAEKVTIYITYSGNSGAKFDREYYLTQHLPLVMKSWTRYGLRSATALFPSGEGTSIVAVCICIFDDNNAVHAAFSSPEATEVMADVKGFTGITPVRTQALELI